LDVVGNEDVAMEDEELKELFADENDVTRDSDTESRCPRDSEDELVTKEVPPKRLQAQKERLEAPAKSSSAAHAGKAKILHKMAKYVDLVYLQTQDGPLSAKWTSMRSATFLFGHGALTASRARLFRPLTRAVLIARRG